MAEQSSESTRERHREASEKTHQEASKKQKRHRMDQDKKHGNHKDGNHHAHMVADFRRRFWISLAITVPILFLSPMIQTFLGIERVVAFPGDVYLLWALSSVVFFYGGLPFLRGLFDELNKKQPGMMTLIAVAVNARLLKMEK